MYHFILFLIGKGSVQGVSISANSGSGSHLRQVRQIKEENCQESVYWNLWRRYYHSINPRTYILTIILNYSFFLFNRFVISTEGLGVKVNNE